MMWSDDAELRGVASLAARLVDTLEGPNATYFAATFVGQMTLAMWKGLAPMFQDQATRSINRMSEGQATKGVLPAPSLPEQDQAASVTQVFDRVASSYSLPSKDCQELVGALPRGVLSAIIKVQARFRGYYFK